MSFVLADWTNFSMNPTICSILSQESCIFWPKTNKATCFLLYSFSSSLGTSSYFNLLKIHFHNGKLYLIAENQLKGEDPRGTITKDQVQFSKRRQARLQALCSNGRAELDRYSRLQLPSSLSRKLTVEQDGSWWLTDLTWIFPTWSYGHKGYCQEGWRQGQDLETRKWTRKTGYLEVNLSFFKVFTKFCRYESDNNDIEFICEDGSISYCEINLIFHFNFHYCNLFIFQSSLAGHSEFIKVNALH